VSGDPVNHSDAAGMYQDTQCGPGWETDPSLGAMLRSGRVWTSRYGPRPRLLRRRRRRDGHIGVKLYVVGPPTGNICYGYHGLL
jgi:hypothetical protein